MSDHICTNASFDVDLPSHTSECPFCLETSELRPGWLGLRCTKCNMINEDGVWYGSLCSHYRKELELTKAQCGKLYGVSKHSIHSYEWRKCPRKYFEFMQNLRRDKNASS